MKIGSPGVEVNVRVAFPGDGPFLRVIGSGLKDKIGVRFNGTSYIVGANGASVSVANIQPDGRPIKEVWINGSTGNDELIVDPSVLIPCKVLGGVGNDTLQGGSGDDVIFGSYGDDTLIPSLGNDQVHSVP